MKYILWIVVLSTSLTYAKDRPVRRLLESSGSQFDREVVQVFIPIAEQDAAEVFAAAGTSTTAAL